MHHHRPGPTATSAMGRLNHHLHHGRRVKTTVATGKALHLASAAKGGLKRAALASGPRPSGLLREP